MYKVYISKKYEHASLEVYEKTFCQMTLCVLSMDLLVMSTKIAPCLVIGQVDADQDSIFLAQRDAELVT